MRIDSEPPSAPKGAEGFFLFKNSCRLHEIRWYFRGRYIIMPLWATMPGRRPASLFSATGRKRLARI